MSIVNHKVTIANRDLPFMHPRTKALVQDGLSGVIDFPAEAQKSHVFCTYCGRTHTDVPVQVEGVWFYEEVPAQPLARKIVWLKIARITCAIHGTIKTSEA